MAWWIFAAYVAAFIAGALLRKKPEGPKPQAVEPPRTEEGEAIPVVFGTMKVSPSVLWWGDNLSVPVKKSIRTLGLTTSRQTIGFRYLVGMQGALCWGPIDELVDIIVDDRFSLASYSTLFERQQPGPGEIGTTQALDVISPDLPATAVAGGLQFTINHPKLFGGREREGGISGLVDFYFGTTSQGENSYLAAKLGSPFPHYKRLCYAVWRQFNWGQSPYLKPWAFVVRRISTTLGTLAGDTSLSRIGNDANPAEVLLELWTHGMGRAANDLDMVSLLTALRRLHCEGKGISGIYRSRAEAESKFEEIRREINAVFSADPANGKMRLTLIRTARQRRTGLTPGPARRRQRMHDTSRQGQA